MRNHTSHTRDAALYQLSRINRWMIAGSVVLTGVLAEVAAHAFPGKTAKASPAVKHGTTSKPSHGSSGAGEQPLASPSQAPESSTQEAAPSQESAPATEPAPSESPTAEATGEPAPQEPAPQESAPSPEAPREPAPEASGPVISGGS